MFNFTLTTSNDTLDMIIGAGLAIITMFYVFLAPIFWFRRRFYYDTTPARYYKELLTTDFYKYVSGEVDFAITRQQLIDFVTYEHERFRSWDFTPVKGVPGSFGSFLGTVIINTGSKRSLSKKMDAKFVFVKRKQALKIIRLEEKYMRRFYPWWHKLI